MNEEIMRTFGAEGWVEAVKSGKCPACLQPESGSQERFTSAKTWREFQISGLCEFCQHQIFAEKLDIVPFPKLCLICGPLSHGFYLDDFDLPHCGRCSLCLVPGIHFCDYCGDPIPVGDEVRETDQEGHPDAFFHADCNQKGGDPS